MNQLTPIESGAFSAGAALSKADFQAIADILYKEARITLAPHKITLVRSRLSRRLRERGLKTFGEYIAFIRRDVNERRIMIDSLTTNHTNFFREKHHFDHLVNEMMPEWRARPAREPVRIWSSASSSGEEVYSIAMSMLGRDAREGQWARQAQVQLLATDISTNMVAAVRAAVYPKSSIDHIPAPYRRLWTKPHPDGFQIADDARNLVQPTQLNLFDRWPMRHQFDAIFCRNVMIYFNEETKIELENRLIDQLVPGGALYIGHSERLMGKGRDIMVPCGHTMYRKPETAK